MTQILDSYKSFWTRYFDFKGTTSKKDFWYAMIPQFIILVLFAGLNDRTGSHILFLANEIFTYATLIPSIAIIVRRLRDANEKPINVLWGLVVIIGWIILIKKLCKPTYVPCDSVVVSQTPTTDTEVEPKTVEKREYLNTDYIDMAEAIFNGSCPGKWSFDTARAQLLKGGVNGVAGIKGYLLTHQDILSNAGWWQYNSSGLIDLLCDMDSQQAMSTLVELMSMNIPDNQKKKIEAKISKWKNDNNSTDTVI